MADYEELNFIIPGYTPETMPLGYLIEYLQQMVVVLGDPDDLHLIGIKEGSCAPVLHVPKATALAAIDRVGKVARGEGTGKQHVAYNRIQRMVRRDAGSAARPALLRNSNRLLLEIYAAPEEVSVLTGIRQASTIDGQLIRVGGAGEMAKLQVQDLDGRILSNITAKRSIAKDLAQWLWEPVRLSGIGQWGRSAEGEWFLEAMQVQSYERLEDESLGVTLERMRSAYVSWPDNVDELLRDQREATL